LKTYLDCVPCFLRQALDVTRQVCGGNEEVTERVLRRVLEATHSLRFELPPPYMGRRIHRIIRDETGLADPYAELKRGSTQTALRLSDTVEKRIGESTAPFRAAVRFAIAGNVMDYANACGWDQKQIDACFDEALDRPVDEKALSTLEESAKAASNILFIGDNAGETVFDRILIQHLPADTVTYAVKGSAVINDATREDANAAGIDRVARLIDNGNDAPGTILELCSQEFCDVFQSADLVIAKGQANIETLHSCDREVFFLTQVKCPVIARNLEANAGDWLVEHWKPDTAAEAPQ
jgi:uncharacterized protein with ATP-grasp and redox domains